MAYINRDTTGRFFQTGQFTAINKPTGTLHMTSGSSPWVDVWDGENFITFAISSDRPAGLPSMKYVTRTLGQVQLVDRIAWLVAHGWEKAK